MKYIIVIVQISKILLPNLQNFVNFYNHYANYNTKPISRQVLYQESWHEGIPIMLFGE